MGSTVVRERRGGLKGGVGRGRLPVVLALAAGLALGLGGAWLALGRDRPVPPSAPLTAAPAATGVEPAVPLTAGERLDVGAATSPQLAVEGFLAAEAARDFPASYAFLSAADRETHPTAAAWVAAHAQLPPVTGFAVEQVRGDEVVTMLGLRSTLDQVMGLVPARSRATWKTVQEEGGWRVVYGSATASAIYPSDEGVGDAARRWAEARVACATEVQHAGSLIGSPALATELCGAAGDVTLGAPGVLPDGPETTALLSAYGPEVFTWARVVPVTAPVPLRAVLGPVADQWQVVGVLPA